MVPGLAQEVPSASIAEHLKLYWHSSSWSFHSHEWWRRNWERSEVVEVERADLVPNGWKLCLTAEEISDKWRDDEREKTVYETALMRVYKGRYLGFTRIVARRNPSTWRTSCRRSRPLLSRLDRDSPG